MSSVATSRNATPITATIPTATRRLRGNERRSLRPYARLTAVMKDVIAPVVDQIASTKPTTVIAIPVEGCWSRRRRLPPRRLVACAGITAEKCAISAEIVSGPTSSVKTPTATSRTAGIAKNVE